MVLLSIGDVSNFMKKSSISGQIGDDICWSFILLLVHLKMVNQCFMWQFSLKITIQTMMIEIINFERHYRYWTFKFRRYEKSSKIKYFHHHFYKQDQTLSDMIISMIISLIIFAHRNFWRLNFFSEISKKISLNFRWDFYNVILEHQEKVFSLWCEKSWSN